LFVPEGYVSRDGNIPVTLHLHGASAIVQREFVRSKSDGVLVMITQNGLSGVYTAKFKDPRLLDSLLSETAAKLATLKVHAKPVLSRVTVSSFSAGFGGVREMLKDKSCYGRIDSLILADSLYCGYVEGTAPPRVDPKLMEGFLRFARDAKEGRKTLVLSHCDLKPKGYASTRETADYLLGELGLARQDVDEEWGKSWRCTSRCRSQGFCVAGFSGDQGSDHMRHLQNLGRLYEEARKKVKE
jgi:hypothetical protein